MTKKIMGLILIMVLLSGLCGLVSADKLPPLPTLKLTVEQSPADCYPPLMMYTAELSFFPSGSSPLTAYFYNITSPTDPIVHLGTGTFWGLHKFMVYQQMNAGTYTAFVTTVINNTTVKSNMVTYKVP